MLGIRRVGADRADYYLSDLAAELPLGDRGAAGRWAGSAAADLVGVGVGLGLVLELGGAEGPVDPHQFRALLDGRSLPGGGRRVAAYDLTFSAPKSASVVFALGGEERAREVVRAHTEAVEGALQYLERHALGAVRSTGGGRGEREVIATSGFTGAVFTHGVSRNLDPHLHSHVVVLNAVHGVDGRWSACDGRGLDAHRRAAGAVYEAQLRDALTSSLGLRWDGPPGRSGEIVGVQAELRGEFSSRAADVRLHAYEAGARSARGHHVAWAATRPPKVMGTTYADLTLDWRRRAEALGSTFEVDRFRSERAPSTSTSTSFDEHRFAGVVSLTPHGGAHRRDVVGAFAVAARDGLPAGSLEQVTEHWAPGGGVGVAEERLTRSSVVPAPHHLHELGPRPLDPTGHETWVGAARAIDAYRGRWGIGKATEPLGADRLSSLPPDRLADHLRLTRHLDAARRSLGRRPPAELELGLGR
jgi:conjugative relaxase-like TrwC/TraI family protein